MNKKIYIFFTFIIIWWILFNKSFLVNNNINEIMDSIVIIVPEQKLISYKNNPKWIISNPKNSWIWAWFFISTNWIIQTVNHIVEDDTLKYKVIYNNKEYSSKIISRDNKTDLALLKIISKENELFPLLTREGARGWANNTNTITSFWINTQNLSIIYNTWIIINTKSKLDNLSNLLEISNKLSPGFSGWPIINSKWNVIWINYAISEWKNYWITF